MFAWQALRRRWCPAAFAWQAQHLVHLGFDFAWQAQHSDCLESVGARWGAAGIRAQPMLLDLLVRVLLSAAVAFQMTSFDLLCLFGLQVKHSRRCEKDVKRCECE